MALLVGKMDADLPKTRKPDRFAEPRAPLPDPSPFGRTASATGPFAQTYQPGS